MAQEIKELIKQLAVYLKKRQMKGFAKNFFQSGRLVLELILSMCRIDITYALLTEGVSTQVIVITSTAGRVVGFAIYWFSAGASLVALPVLASTLFLRSVLQQIRNQRDYLTLKELVNRMLDDDELKQRIRVSFMEGEIPRRNGIEMKGWDSNKNTLPEFNFDSDQTFDEFIKAKIKKEFGLIENTTPKQIEKIIDTRKIKKRPKGKTVYFKDFVKEIAENTDDIIDAEIVKKTIEVKVKNEEL